MSRRSREQHSKPLLTKISDTIMSVDKYGERASFNIAGKSTYPSILGTLVSIIVLVVVIPYGLNKFLIMKEYGDTNFMSISVKNAIDKRQEFDFDETQVNMMFYFA